MDSKPFNNLSVRTDIVESKILIQVGVISPVEGEMSAHVYLNSETAEGLANCLDALAQAVRGWDQKAVAVH